VVPSQLPELAQPWIELAADPAADPLVPGYAILLEFEVRPGGEPGRGFFVRLSAAGEEPLFRGERRDWAMVVELPTTGALAIQYAYLDPDRPADLWTYDPRERRLRRVQTWTTRYRDPIYSVCEVVSAGGLASGVELKAASAGRVTRLSQVRRALSVRKGCR
jgi:hypothetical protein